MDFLLGRPRRNRFEGPQYDGPANYGAEELERPVTRLDYVPEHQMIMGSPSPGLKDQYLFQGSPRGSYKDPYYASSHPTHHSHNTAGSQYGNQFYNMVPGQGTSHRDQYYNNNNNNHCSPRNNFREQHVVGSPRGPYEHKSRPSGSPHYREPTQQARVSHVWGLPLKIDF